MFAKSLLARPELTKWSKQLLSPHPREQGEQPLPLAAESAKVSWSPPSSENGDLRTLKLRLPGGR
jgi:hypothetical protein